MLEFAFLTSTRNFYTEVVPSWTRASSKPPRPLNVTTANAGAGSVTPTEKAARSLTNVARLGPPAPWSSKPPYAPRS
jgi:hypothetical protein